MLSGGTPYANFKDLAHAWGREKGFHTVLANNVCERRGEVERKRRSDAGKIMSNEERAILREKMKKPRGDLPEEQETIAAEVNVATMEVPPVEDFLPEQQEATFDQADALPTAEQEDTDEMKEAPIMAESETSQEPNHLMGTAQV